MSFQAVSIQTVAVLGAGVMGCQIAAHLANIGLDVDLLDLSSSGNPNQGIEAAFQRALKLKPPIFYSEKFIDRVRLGNFDQHFNRISEADWIIEAVVENLAIKQSLMQRIEAIAKPEAIVSTNTSGLPIGAIAVNCSEGFRQRFLGTHFFNPPRYLKLLELIPGPKTDPDVLETMQRFAQRCLGKGVIVAKDTPNFIANRIGMFVMLHSIHQLEKGNFTIPEIDAMTGTLMGRPKSATFRTADLVGLDTISHVAHHLYQAVPNDEARETFRVPALIEALVQRGFLGAKSGQGFYQNEKGQILSWNPKTDTYETTLPIIQGLEKLQHIHSLPDRLNELYRNQGRVGEFFRETMLPILAYCAHRIPEIAESPAEIDQAMRWGFGWEIGPFEIWDTLGFSAVTLEMNHRKIMLPRWIQDMATRHDVGFYHRHTKPATLESPQGSLFLGNQTAEIDLNQIRRDPSRVIWHNSESALLDLGDGVALFEFRSKGNTLSLKVLEGLAIALDLLSDHTHQGMVIGNGQAHFSGGANLVEMGGMAQSGDTGAIQDLIVTFQNLLERIHTFPKPIVAAVQGRALGGGCELVMACPTVVAAAESYIGLVELSVGLIPGAGGITRLVSEVTRRAMSNQAAQIQPFVIKAFETIAMAKVSSSAYEAQSFGYLKPSDTIVVDGDRRLSVAKARVQQLAENGYIAPSRRATVMVLGQPGRAMMEMMANQMLDGHYISPYDRFLASELAYVMTGGSLTAPTVVPESYLLKLERERFVPLLNQPKTQARIAHLLKTKKPLRN